MADFTDKFDTSPKRAGQRESRDAESDKQSQEGLPVYSK